jgi:hypothetical protein
MKLFLPLIAVFLSSSAFAQDSLLKKIPKPDKYLAEVNKTATRINNDLDKRTNKLLSKLYSVQAKMQQKLQKVAPTAAAKVFDQLPAKREAYVQSVMSQLPGNSTGIYDNTQQSTLSFLKGNDALTGKAGGQLAKVSQNYAAMTSKLQEAEQIKQFIRQRRQQLIEQVGKYAACTKQLKVFKEEVYAYSTQIQSYKDMLSDPKKAEAKALEVLKQLPAYNDFIKRNSLLAGLFNLSPGYNDIRSLEGLQNRTQVQQLVTQQVGTAPNAQQLVNQQMDAARTKLDELKSKFPGLDNAAEMPDFKPNEMKHKRLVERLEFGGNLQFQRSNQYFPTTTDIAGQVAYKFNKNGSIGLGASYKLGMGTGWNHIAFSHQGFGLRSFMDWKLKGTFFANGGFELNRANGFAAVSDLLKDNAWQVSALLGISKKYKINSKLKGNIMVLYDFLATRQVPSTSPIKVRMGYTF